MAGSGNGYADHGDVEDRVRREIAGGPRIAVLYGEAEGAIVAELAGRRQGIVGAPWLRAIPAGCNQQRSRRVTMNSARHAEHADVGGA